MCDASGIYDMMPLRPVALFPEGKTTRILFPHPAKMYFEAIFCEIMFLFVTSYVFAKILYLDKILFLIICYVN